MRRFVSSRRTANLIPSQKNASQALTVEGTQNSRVSPRKLSDMDWDFRDASTNYLSHGLHPYPAKFIPQIPQTLIREFSSVGDTVGDIFCGSGTTLVEGLLLKRHVIGIDANPLACLISAAKTSQLTA